jgi:ABC-type sugar transport system ATPase subunit
MTHLFEMRGLRKSYEAVHALAWTADTTVTVDAGSILGLAGENGAGKSTLLGSLTGSVKLDAGDLLLDGASYGPTGPFDALSRGVALIPQETLLSPTLTVAENVLLGREKEYTRVGMVRTRRRDALARAALGLVDLDIDVHETCGSLPIEHKKMIELARALAAEPRVLLVDETSNVLSRDGADILFNRMEAFARGGGAVIFVTHRLDEIINYCTDVAILKDGAVVSTQPTSDITEQGIAHAMVGRALEAEINKVDHETRAGDVVLEVDRLQAPGCVEFSLDLRAGEIVGIGGLVGCGADVVARTIAGAVRPSGGTISVNGRDLTKLDLRGRIAAGIAYVPKDRDDEGLLLGASILDNIALGSLDRYSRAGFVARSAGLTGTAEQIRALSIKADGPQTSVQNLSGGNRQKVLLARWLHRDVPVLILNNPTRGVDVGAKGDIYELLDAARRDGKAIIVVSDELPELLRLSDRVLVMRRGEVSDRRERPLPTEHELIGAML